MKASENYPVRNFGKENEKLEKYIKKAEQLKEELSKDGIEASVITEEPFVGVKDSIEKRSVKSKGRIKKNCVNRLFIQI